MAGGTTKILVVENDPGLRAALERLLAEAGLEPRGYPCAEALLEAGGAEAADCIVCDLRLPARSGVELLAEARRRGWTTPVIVMSAYTAEEARAACLSQGAVAYLGKPFGGAELLAAIRVATQPAGAPAEEQVVHPETREQEPIEKETRA